MTGQVDGSDAMVRESGTVSLIGSQMNSLMDPPGGGMGLMGKLAWRGWRMGLFGP